MMVGYPFYYVGLLSKVNLWLQQQQQFMAVELIMAGIMVFEILCLSQ